MGVKSFFDGARKKVSNVEGSANKLESSAQNAGNVVQNASNKVSSKIKNNKALKKAEKLKQS